MYNNTEIKQPRNNMNTQQSRTDHKYKLQHNPKNDSINKQ